MLIGLFIILLVWCVPEIYCIGWLRILGTIIGLGKFINNFFKIVELFKEN